MVEATQSVVALEGVTVQYGTRAALRDASAVFPSGAVGLLGPNGAGKSTLLKTLLGFLAPHAGRSRVFDLDPAKAARDVRARLGYMPENEAYVPGMTGVAFVAYFARLAGLPREDAMQRAHEILYYVGLGEARYRKLETYSTGMKQRAKLAQALVHDPDLLFLDEPTNGMDPRGREEMLDLIFDLGHRKGMNLVLSSHLLPDVERCCDHVVVLDRGRVVAQGSIDALKGPAGRVFELRVKGAEQPFLRALEEAGMETRPGDGDIARVFIRGDGSAREIFRLAENMGVQVRHLKPSLPTLEDVFAHAVGEETHAS